MLLFENGPIKHPRHLVIFHFLPFCFVLFFCVLLFSTYLENTALYTDSHDNRAMCNNHRRWLCEWSFYFCWFWPHSVSSLYTGVVLFFFSFFYKTSASTWAKRARSTRKKNNPTATPLRWRSINSPWFICVRERATLFLFLSVSCWCHGNFSRSTISFVSTQCIFLLVRSFIDPMFCGIFVCGPSQFKP